MMSKCLSGAAVAGALLAQAAVAATVSSATVNSPTATPIRHLVVIYGENESFDHDFATYPHATNPPGEPAFVALPGTPKVNGLSGTLLTHNPNAASGRNGADAADPFRLDRSQAATADQNHAYTAEQQAYDNGRADLFPLHTGRASPGGAGAFGTRGQVMGYYDGNTVTALWNYAQHFAMSDAAYTDTYGPSTPGALAVVSGQTNGARIVKTSKKPSTLKSPSYYIADGQGGDTLMGDVDPAGDICSNHGNQVRMQARNIGDLLNEAGVTWGGFMGGFNLARVNPDHSTGCRRTTYNPVVGHAVVDYIPHHAWFQYAPSTANPTHARPSSLQAIGHTFEAGSQTRDPANHAYGMHDFFDAVRAGDFPAVSFLKAPAYQDGHAGYSDPLDEQAFIVKVLNFLQQQPAWAHTAVILAWDDSDGWYDHAYTPPTNASFDAQADQLQGPGRCGTGQPRAGVDGKPVNGRCGPGTRTPFLVISPWARPNHVGHTLLIQSSISRFIEDNWLGGKRLGDGSFDATAGSIMDLFDFKHGGKLPPLYLDPVHGTVLAAPPRTQGPSSAS